jgi:hypothetical protein
MTEIYVSELGGFCMGRRFFWLPKGGGYRKRGVTERGVGHGSGHGVAGEWTVQTRLPQQKYC